MASIPLCLAQFQKFTNAHDTEDEDFNLKEINESSSIGSVLEIKFSETYRFYITGYTKVIEKYH